MRELIRIIQTEDETIVIQTKLSQFSVINLFCNLIQNMYRDSMNHSKIIKPSSEEILNAQNH
jgi:hypothetical protein